MSIQKPASPPNSAPVKAHNASAPPGKSAPDNAPVPRHKTAAFAHYMSADGRPKEAFHPYRDTNAPQTAPSGALLAKSGIMRPLMIAALPQEAGKRQK